MRKVIYKERGISVYNDGTILLFRCPKCGRENYALNVTSGLCAWCDYDAREDEGLKERITANTRPQDYNSAAAPFGSI